MFVHDIIKIRYTSQGYLPDYPYHLISDEEMCDAFLSGTKETINDETHYVFTESDYFHDNYPLIADSMQSEYDTLRQQILDEIIKFKEATTTDAVLPDWVYSYMLGVVVGPNSDKMDIHDLLVLLGKDNIDDVFTEDASIACYNISTSWVKRFGVSTEQSRPPTLFGEPHVIKSLRLQNIDN